MEAKEKAVEELKILVSFIRDYFALWLKAVAVYFAAIGILAKLLFDAQPGSFERIAFFVFGNFINLCAIIFTLIGKRPYTRIAKRCDEVSESMNIPNVYSPGTIAMAKAFVGGMIIFSIMWMCLILVLK